MTKVEVFERIILQQEVEELVPFLLTLSKEEVLAVRKRVQTLAHELEDVRQKGEQHWEKGPTQLQYSLFFLTRLATYSQKEALAPAFINSLWALNRSLLLNPESGFLPPDKLTDFVCQLLTHRRPSWLDAWLGNTLGSSSTRGLNFDVLLKLEHHGLIISSPRLLALSGVSELTNYGAEANTLVQLHKYQKDGIKLTTSQIKSLLQLTRAFAWVQDAEQLPSIEGLVYERIARNKDLLERAIPLFFEFDTELNWSMAHTVEYRINKWISWHDMLVRLTAAGHLDRADLLTRCVLALRRDFRRPLLTWFKELFASLKPTTTERLARQADLVELLAHPLPLVVNFAIEQLKNVWLEPGFDLAPLLRYADNLLTRPDLKTGLKTLLSGLLKLSRQNAAHAPAGARLLAAALAHADSAVQERAAKGLATLLQAKKPLLSAEDHADTLLAINNQMELLAAPARTVLAAWLAAPTTTDGLTARYAPLSQFVPKISADTAIAPVADWHELLFLTGEMLHYDDPSAEERWLDGLLRLHGQLPAGHAEQLRPYLVQTLPFLKNKTEAQTEAILAETHTSGHWGLWQALLLSWAQGFRTLRVPGVPAQVDHNTSDPLVLVERQRLAAAERHLQQRNGLPLLSTPTHTPYWIAPDQLVQKLLRYEAAQVAPDAADLAVALARTAYAADSATVLPLLAQLHHEGLRGLLSWFLSPDAAALCLAPPARKSVLQQVAARLRNLLPGEAAADETLTEALPWLWAVAARTKFPEQEFAACPALPGADYPGVQWPWVPAWEFEVKTTKQVEYWKAGKPEITHRTVQLTFPSEYTSQGAPSPLLLYSLHARFQGMAHGHWQLSATIRSLSSLLPHNLSTLHWHVVRSAAWTDKLETTERDVLMAALPTLLNAGPVFAESTTLLLATSLLHHTPSCRALALEVLLSASATGRLQPAALGQLLGRLLAAEYAPLARLADLLPQALAVSPETDDALRQILDGLLPELPAAPLRNLRKLLELYADLAARNGRAVPADVQGQLAAWQAAPALKKAAVALLA